MKQYFSRIIILAAIALQAMIATAAVVDADQAQAWATGFLSSQAQGKLMSHRAPLMLAHAEKSALDAEKSDFYVFNTTDGSAFVIVAGDDRAESILGYGEGSIDMNQLPCNLKWMLDSYKEQIEWLHAHPAERVAVSEPYSDVVIAPMLTCNWSQSAPYYNQCPEVEGQRCVTGCIATAMAQALYYWKQPEKAPALGSYTTRSHRITLDALPSKVIDWQNLIDSYSGAYSEEQANAVAMLMRYCGQASHMDYSPDGSGAYVRSQLNAVRSFGYSRASMMDRSDYSLEEWEGYMQTDLQAGRPILYSGNDGLAGGHAFVLDGYYQGKYHINWGWAGTGNGYFSLGAFNVQGYSFNSQQQMIHNMYPSNNGDPETGYDFVENGIYYMFNEECTGLLVTYKDTKFNTYQGDITIPEEAVFEGETYPVVGIAPSAFRNCNELHSVTMPATITTIDNYAFRNCIGMNAITLPEGIVSIGAQAFANCLNLNSLALPASTQDIGSMAFQDCLNLTHLEAASLESWLGISFADHYANPLSYAHHLYIGGNEVTDLVIPDDFEAINAFAFIECDGLTSLTVQNNTLRLGKAAFAYCTGINSITLPETLETIEDQAFYGCKGLTQVDIPSSVTRLKYAAFSDCSGLTQINLPGALTEIENAVFLGCSRLPAIAIPESVVSIGSKAFNGCAQLAELTIPASVTTIGSSAFSGCTGLTSLVIPNSVTNVGNDAFNGCSKLKSLKISNALTVINSGVFADCTELTSVIIPNNVETICSDAFYRCVYLNELTIGKGTEFIENTAFSNCNRLTKVTCLATTPPVLENPDCFSRLIYPKATLMVPPGSIDSYRNGGVWAWFSKIIGIEIVGDVNNDNEVNIADVNEIIDAIISGSKKANCDVNGDGEVNIGDVNLVIDKIINGL